MPGDASLRAPLIAMSNARGSARRVSCGFDAITISALLVTYMLLHIAKADGHVAWLRWPLVLLPLLALPACTLALVVYRGVLRPHRGRLMETAAASPPPAAALALGASCVSSLAFGFLVSNQLSSAEGRGVAPPPIPAATWALSLCPLAAAILLRSYPRLSAAGRPTYFWSPRGRDGTRWQRLSSEEASESDATAEARSGWPDNTAGWQPVCAASRRHSAAAAGEDTGGEGRIRMALAGEVRDESEIGGGKISPGREPGPAPASTRGTGSFSKPGSAGLFLEAGTARAAAVGSLAVCLFLASGGLLCAKMGGALEWGWQAVASPAW